MQKITPFLWFDTQAEEAANFYVSVFKNSKTGKIEPFYGVQNNWLPRSKASLYKIIQECYHESDINPPCKPDRRLRSQKACGFTVRAASILVDDVSFLPTKKVKVLWTKSKRKIMSCTKRCASNIGSIGGRGARGSAGARRSGSACFTRWLRYQAACLSG